MIRGKSVYPIAALIAFALTLGLSYLLSLFFEMKLRTVSIWIALFIFLIGLVITARNYTGSSYDFGGAHDNAGIGQFRAYDTSKSIGNKNKHLFEDAELILDIDTIGLYGGLFSFILCILLL